MNRAYPKTEIPRFQQCLPIDTLRNLETRTSDLLGVIELIGESKEPMIYGSNFCLQGNHTLLKRTQGKYRRRRVNNDLQYESVEVKRHLRRSKKMKARRLESGDTNCSTS